MSRRTEQLRELLLSEHFKQSFFGRLEKCRIELREQEDHSPTEVLPGMTAMSEDCFVIRENMASVFEKRIIEPLGWPPIVTVEDLEEQTVYQLAGVKKEGFDQAVQRLHYFLHEKIEMADRSAKTIRLGTWRLPMKTENQLAIEERIWQVDKDDVAIILEFTRQPPFTVSVAAYLRGCATDGAMQAGISQLEQVLPSIAASISKLDWETDEEGELEQVDVMQRLMLSAFPCVSKLLCGQGRWFLSECIATYFQARRENARSLAYRCQNALQLLVEADHQDNPAIALSLCFSALEALLCNKKDGIVDELSRRIAALLNPVAIDRPDTIKAIKALYGIRCDAVHGKLSVARGDARVRTLAAATLRAVLEWKEHCRRMGETPTDEGFIRELENAVITGSRMVGVPDKLRIHLPSD